MTGGPTVADVGERALIARIASRVPPAPAWVQVGIGDDGAVLRPPPRAFEVVTTDALVEGVHFERGFVPPGDVGAKALAVNLSDLAAMGASPRAAVLSLGLPASLGLDDYDALVEGVVGLAAGSGVALVGGNVTRSPGPLFVDVTALGAVHPRKVLMRSGARVGDGLYLSGRAGGAAAGLAALRAGLASGAPGDDGNDRDLADAVRCYRRPEARVRLGLLVGRNRAASACIDTSDGLADAVRQVAEASGTGAIVDAGAVPWHPAVAATWGDTPEARWQACSGSDDYELLFAVPPRRRRTFEGLASRSGVPVTRIGRITAERRVVLLHHGEEIALPVGYAHFG